MAIQLPASLRRVKPLTPRAAILGVIGLEYLLFAPLYAYVLQWCHDTVGDPYRAALAHYEAAAPAQAAVEPTDAWDMPSWEPSPTSGWSLDDDAIATPDTVELDTEQADPAAAPEAPTKPLPNPLMPDFWAVLALIGTLLANTLLWFVQRWLIGVRAAIKYAPARRMDKGTHLFITPHPHQGAAEIVQVQSQTLDGQELLFVVFQRQRYEVDAAQQRVTEMDCQVDRPVGDYTKSRGLPTAAAVQLQRQRFGSNSLHIPIPKFQEIFCKQMLGPVPVFQVLCTCLWLMDEYWNYALFNVFSICMFEASTAFGRLKNLSTLRSMRNKEITVQVLRAGTWAAVSTEDLVPGDVFCLYNDGVEDPTVPCDALILHGAAVANEASLTGESTPQMKEAAQAEGTAAREPLDMAATHRSHCLYSGTTLMQHTTPSADVVRLLQLPESGGCVCYCLRTGFSSSQGQLVRMIEYSSEQVMSDAKETLALLFLLLLFALMASGYVLRKGLQEGKKSQYELVLRCVLILTSVVPPELPMQTALAVNTALMALWKTQVFCTEPFRIPDAGKIDVCLFDKTGTLTTDQLVCVGTVVMGAAANDPTPRPVAPIAATSWPMAVVMGGCHALVQVGEKVCGDPIETESVKALGWSYNARTSTCTPGDKPAAPCIDKGSSCKILFRYHFSSKLQRMATITRVAGKGGGGTWLLVKGSPEAVGRLLAKQPAAYATTYRAMAENGMRVLALAYRPLEGDEVEAASTLAATGRGVAREDLERELLFAGFVAFSCKVRKDTKLVVSELQKGSNRVIMATGDAALTALHVSMEVGITNVTDPTKALLLQTADDGQLVWQQMRESHQGGDATGVTEGTQGPLVLPFAVKSMAALRTQGYDLCVTGESLRAAEAADERIWTVTEHVSVYARMAPDDKERVIRALREHGHHTLMCGDGANDVGALKQAHVGVALLSGFGGANTAKEGEKALDQETPEEKAKRLAETAEQMAAKRATAMAEAKKDRLELQELQKVWFQEEAEKLTRAGETWVTVKAIRLAMGRMMAEQRRRIDERNKRLGLSSGANAITAGAALNAADMDTGEVPMVKLGDASVAAPFTSKLPSIRSCVDVVRQGRCTLVSTIQMQQILALNCLIAAYSLSALFLDGVRSGEAQMIASGILLTVASLAFTYARPVQELSPVRPITSLFHPAISLSIAGQLAIHLYCMVSAISMAKEFSTAEEIEEAMGLNADAGAPPPIPDAAAADAEGTTALLTPFKPSLLNTVVFLIETAQQVSVMAVNYKGRPFMIASTENRPMLYSLLACCAGTFIAAFEVIPMLNEKLQLVPLPTDAFRHQLLRTLGMSVFGALAWDRVCTLLFARRLVLAGYRDAWNAFKGRENLEAFTKGAVGLAFLGLFLWTENIMVPLLGWWMYKKLKAGPPKPMPTAVVAPATAAAAAGGGGASGATARR